MNWEKILKEEIKYRKPQINAVKKLMSNLGLYFMGSQDLYYLSEYLQKAMRNNTIPEDAEKELQELIDDLENVQNKLEKTLKKANKLIGRDDVSLDKV